MICENCGAEMDYVSEKNRWICPECGWEDFD